MIAEILRTEKRFLPADAIAMAANIRRRLTLAMATPTRALESGLRTGPRSAGHDRRPVQMTTRGRVTRPAMCQITMGAGDCTTRRARSPRASAGVITWIVPRQLRVRQIVASYHHDIVGFNDADRSRSGRKRVRVNLQIGNSCHKKQ
jgi:hypothetical protein